MYANISRETQKEFEAVRTVLQRVPKFNNQENESAVISHCRTENKAITVQTAIDAFSRLRDAGRLKVNENTAEVVRTFLNTMPKYRGVNANERMLAAAFEENKPMELPDVFNRVKHQLAINSEYAQAYQEFFQKHPELVLEANVRILDDAHHGDDVTAESLDQLLMPGNPSGIASQLGVTPQFAQAQADEAERQAIIAQVTKTLVDAKGKPLIDARGRQVTYNELGQLTGYKGEIERIQNASLQDLRRIRDDRAERQRLRSMGSDELRRVVRANAPAAYSRYEQITPTYIPPGKLEGVPWSFALFKRLPSTEQRRLLDHFGHEQLDAACAVGRS